MIRRPPRSTLSSSSAASDVYKRQVYGECECNAGFGGADCSTRFCGAGIALEAARSPGSTKTLGHACSGRGRCTTLGACDCDRGYWGEWCEKGDGQAVLVDMA
eukprot:TRINITY_DN19239_c0_g1_i1.p3 TRINITY_DN19239_c0_g1~~TRINITY_DN19239_c0_g1_i1.p3  ORF type:complete len:103 (+),score=22.45 TRINITY_DN19239_c0_g1_i1:85-393(+)